MATSDWERPFYIKESGIPGAGLGLFTRVPLECDFPIGKYAGTILSAEELSRLPDARLTWEIKKDPNSRDSHDNVYGYVNADASSPEGNLLRFVNCPRNREEENLVARQINFEIWYFTCRQVSVGEELLVWYGSDFGNVLVGTDIYLGKR
ncbi:MAG: SET domain-containing protein-lysine N-methyltransferase [Sulfobacillus sp.]